MSRMSRMLLLVLFILAGAGGIAAAKGESAKPSNVTSAVATTTANPAKGDGRVVLKDKGVPGKGNSDAINQIFGVSLDTGNIITLIGVIATVGIALITAIWAFFKWIYPILSVKSAKKKQLEDFAERHKATLREQIQKQSLSTTAFDSVSVTLADTFVPLRLSDTLRNETRFMPGSSYNNQSSDSIRSPEEVLRMAFKKKYRKLLVVGEPGSGKTTLLYYYALFKPVTGKTHVGERRERRPNGDVYLYERVTAYNEQARKTYTVSQKLKGKIKSGSQEVITTRPKKRKGEGSWLARCASTAASRIFWSGSEQPPALTMTCDLCSSRATQPRFSPLRDTGSVPTETPCHALRVGR
jgi:hypothetical protein